MDQVGEVGNIFCKVGSVTLEIAFPPKDSPLAIDQIFFAQLDRYYSRDSMMAIDRCVVVIVVVVIVVIVGDSTMAIDRVKLTRSPPVHTLCILKRYHGILLIIKSALHAVW